MIFREACLRLSFSPLLWDYLSIFPIHVFYIKAEVLLLFSNWDNHGKVRRIPCRLCYGYPWLWACPPAFVNLVTAKLVANSWSIIDGALLIKLKYKIWDLCQLTFVVLFPKTTLISLRSRYGTTLYYIPHRFWIALWSSLNVAPILSWILLRSQSTLWFIC